MFYNSDFESPSLSFQFIYLPSYCYTFKYEYKNISINRLAITLPSIEMKPCQSFWHDIKLKLFSSCCQIRLSVPHNFSC